MIILTKHFDESSLQEQDLFSCISSVNFEVLC